MLGILPVRSAQRGDLRRHDACGIWIRELPRHAEKGSVAHERKEKNLPDQPDFWYLGCDLQERLKGNEG
jgi:hypothetical protein